MSREYQISHDGQAWIFVSGEVFAAKEYPYSRWRDAPGWTIAEEPHAKGKYTMTFAEVLPHLAAGRRATRCGFTYRWQPNRLEMQILGTDSWTESTDSSHASASDWTLVEEPTPLHPCDACLERNKLRAILSRLTRELNSARDAVINEGMARDRLTRELDEARNSLASEIPRRVNLERELAEAKRGEDPTLGTWGSNDGKNWIKVTDGRTAHFRYLRNIWRSDG